MKRESTAAGLDWFTVRQAAEIATPALLFYRDRIHRNIHQMIRMVEAGRLRPHLKTHKTSQILQMQQTAGIHKVKCATVAEAELAAQTGIKDVLWAFQPVGPAIHRVAELMRGFPHVQFSVLVDDARVVADLARELRNQRPPPELRLQVLLDLDLGQHRTGISSVEKACELYRQIAAQEPLIPGGLHAYDGHVSQADPGQRKAACELAFSVVQTIRKRLEQQGVRIERIVAGGTPTFPFHAKRPEVECSPGTCVLWDAGYNSKLADLDFLPAALVLSRVISKPTPTRLCLDLGHKAIASEMPQPRVLFLNLPGANAVLHSEEHLVVETEKAAEFAVGDCIYGIPWHICPTVALHSEAVIIDQGNVVDRWAISARARKLTI